MKQRDKMRELKRIHQDSEDKIVAAYAAAERAGEVTRISNSCDIAPEVFARMLYNDGIRKGWIHE